MPFLMPHVAEMAIACQLLRPDSLKIERLRALRSVGTAPSKRGMFINMRIAVTVLKVRGYEPFLPVHSNAYFSKFFAPNWRRHVHRRCDAQGNQMLAASGWSRKMIPSGRKGTRGRQGRRFTGDRSCVRTARGRGFLPVPTYRDRRRTWKPLRLLPLYSAIFCRLCYRWLDIFYLPFGHLRKLNLRGREERQSFRSALVAGRNRDAFFQPIRSKTSKLIRYCETETALRSGKPVSQNCMIYHKTT
jgi:hypothetical protein